jgi:photosystem II stability/assembly factor-like uncharacterized protein
MRILFITTLYTLLSAFIASPENATNTVPSNTGLRCTPAPGAANIIYQSLDGGQTWQDISFGLPADRAPEDFFAGESEIYLRMADGMYRSKTNLKTPEWKKDNGLVISNTCINFTQSGAVAYNYRGDVLRRTSAEELWLPVYRNLEPRLVRTVFELADGSVLVGSDHGLFKSADRGKSWKQVQDQGWVTEIVESEGVLVATGQQGIMRSTDKGEHWEWVITEGGVGIEVERIDGGFAAISASSKTISRRVHISLDKGKTWQAIDEGLRPSLSISSIKQVGPYLLCGHPDGVFRSSDHGKTWYLVHSISEKKVKNIGTSWTVVDSRVEGKVLKLYTSGNLVYAVVRDEGC